MFALAVVCAILSGWTSAVAQARDEGMVAAHHPYHGLHVAGQEQADHETGRLPSDCGHAGKCLHPMLCAACFAVQVTAEGLTRRLAERSAILPLVDLPLVSNAPQPTSPPPKTYLSM